jgi:hypothetical protein
VLFIIPRSNASLELIILLLKIRSFVALNPTISMRFEIPPNEGVKPSLMPGKPNFAS